MPQQPTGEEREWANAAGLDPAVLVALREHTDKPFLPLQVGGEEGAGAAPIPGVAVAVAHAAEAETLIGAVGPALAPLGCAAFWSERHEPNGLKDTDEVMILQTDDPFAAVRLKGSNGRNHGVSTDDVIGRLQTWTVLCAFRVVGAAEDWVALQFDTLPENVCSFAEEVYLFCPDSVEQGVGLMREADHPEAFARARALCPDVSQRVRERTRAAFSPLRSMDPAVAAQFRALLGAAAAATTPVAMGVRLLAEDIRTTRHLHLWWD